jgi:hypothetical protein
MKSIIMGADLQSDIYEDDKETKEPAYNGDEDQLEKVQE